MRLPFLTPARTPRARALAVAGSLVLVGTVAVVPHAAADDLKNKQKAAHGEVHSAQGALEESSTALNAAAARLSKARTALVSAQKHLAVAEADVEAAARVDEAARVRLQAAEHTLAMTREALDAAQRRVTDQRSAIGQLAASNYATGDPALMGLAVMLNSQDPAEVTSQLNTVDALMDKQTALLASLRHARAQLVTEEAKVQKAKAVVAVQRRAARANLVHSQDLERSAASARSDVAALVVRSRAAQTAAAAARSRDLVELRVAKKQESRIKELILERASRQRGGYRGATGGLLQPPVPGYVTSSFGWRTHPIYHYWGLHDGTDFHAPCGTPERASRSGTVISEVWSEVYGNRLYVDLGQVNGRNMTVVYNHLSAYNVSTGQRVSRGQVVGLAGTTGWSTACHLHFTVMLDGTPVDPMGFM